MAKISGNVRLTIHVLTRKIRLLLTQDMELITVVLLNCWDPELPKEASQDKFGHLPLALSESQAAPQAQEDPGLLKPQSRARGC